MDHSTKVMVLPPCCLASGWRTPCLLSYRHTPEIFRGCRSSFPGSAHRVASQGRPVPFFFKHRDAEWQFVFSHINAETPGCIHEGGELGYALSVSFGAVMDNPDLIVACVVGDGEAETGPTATYVHPFSVDYLLADIYPSQVLGMASSTSIPPSRVRSSLLFM